MDITDSTAAPGAVPMDQQKHHQTMSWMQHQYMGDSGIQSSVTTRVCPSRMSMSRSHSCVKRVCVCGVTVVVGRRSPAMLISCIAVIPLSPSQSAAYSVQPSVISPCAGIY